MQPPPQPGERVAIIGSGISGLVCAYLLHRDYDVHVFEQNDYLGGHTHTVEVDDAAAGRLPVDTGFIVFNDWTYPNFITLLERLGVAWQDSLMTFSVRCDRSGLEYAGGTLDGLFAQRRNLVRPRFYRMLLDILRFYREAPGLLDEPGDESLGDFVARRGYSRIFIEQHLIPMGAAIWSADPDHFLDTPARFAIRFFVNHGMLNVLERPRWRTVTGGAATYVRRIRERVGPDRFHLGCPVWNVRRAHDHVTFDTPAGRQRCARIIIAAHGDQALPLLGDPSPPEREILGAFRYQPNLAVLHTDTTALPRARRAWASWNYHLTATGGQPDAAGRADAPGRPGAEAESARATLTYNMNMLQSLPAGETYCVTLNPAPGLDPQRILRQIEYAHPVFSPAAVRAQQRHEELNGARRTYFCGAYWRYGFHEDGVVSALAVGRKFGQRL